MNRGLGDAGTDALKWFTQYIEPENGVSMVSGVVAPNGNSVALTRDQFIALVNAGKLSANHAVLAPQDIPGSDAGMFLGGPQQAPVVAGGNAPVTVSNPTMMPNNPATATPPVPTTPQGQQIINSSGASSGAATPPATTDWFTESMFGGIPNWGLLAAAAVAAFFVMRGGK